VKHGWSAADTAYVVGCHRSTICRELKRNTNEHGNYVVADAQRLAKQRRYRKPQGIRLKNEIIRAYVEETLLLGWSPEQIAGRLPQERPGFTLHHETIYRYVYREARRGETKWVRRLPSRRHRRTQRYRETTPSRKVNITPRRHGKRLISERPPEIGARARHGDWEIDTVVGRRQKSVLAVCVERASGYARIARPVDRTASSMRHAVMTALGGLPRFMQRSITCDNGSENAEWRSMERILNLPIYFCDPYKSWQKGVVENLNGLIRRAYPKKTDFACISQGDIIRLQHTLNNRPRKRLGWQTPAEVFEQALARGGEP